MAQSAERSLLFSLGQSIKGLTPEFAVALNGQLGSYNDETKMSHLAILAKNPSFDIWQLNEVFDLSELINWSRDIQKYPPHDRHIVSRVFRKVSVLEQLQQQGIIDRDLEIDTLGRWRRTDAGIIVQAGLNEKVTRFMKKITVNQSHS